MRSSALSVADFIARWRAACSDAAGVEQRGVDARVDVARQQKVEDALRRRLELVRPHRGVAVVRGVFGDLLACERHQPCCSTTCVPDATRTACRRSRRRRRRPRGKARRRRTHLPGVFVRGTLREAAERGVDAVLPVAEVALGLPPDEDERVVDPGALCSWIACSAARITDELYAPDKPRSAAMTMYADLADVGSGREQQAVVRPAAGGEVVHDLGDRLAVRLRGGDVRLRPAIRLAAINSSPRVIFCVDWMLLIRLRRILSLPASHLYAWPVSARGRSLAGERSTRSARSAAGRRGTRDLGRGRAAAASDAASAARRRRTRRGTRPPRPRACRPRECARSRGSRRADRSTGREVVVQLALEALHFVDRDVVEHARVPAYTEITCAPPASASSTAA